MQDHLHLLNERSQRLLRILVDRYIRDGEPIGSRTLAEDPQLSLSPATIRHIMADLEERGYIHSPHTSAGRVPTQQGYRFFVNSLLSTKPFDPHTVHTSLPSLDPTLSAQHLITSASTLLSNLTQLAGLVTLPRHEQLVLRHIEFLPLSDRRVLVILVINEREVQNRVIYTDHIYSPTELQAAAQYLTTTYAGCDLKYMREDLLTRLQAEREQMNALMQAAIEVGDKALDESSTTESDYVLAGQENLLELVDATGVNRLRQLFEAFTEKRGILHLLDQCVKAEGIQIYIGQESGYAALDVCTLVTAPYSVDGSIVGVLGVIGPTRMPYEQVIQTVDLTAKLLSTALNQAK